MKNPRTRAADPAAWDKMTAKIQEQIRMGKEHKCISCHKKIVDAPNYQARSGFCGPCRRGRR